MIRKSQRTIAYPAKARSLVERKPDHAMKTDIVPERTYRTERKPLVYLWNTDAGKSTIRGNKVAVFSQNTVFLK